MKTVDDVASGTIAKRQLGIAHALIATISVVVLMQVELVFSKSINWDEFFHFSEIHRHLQDRPMLWLQVPYVWLFSWVPSLSGDNITHIQIIRLLILPFELIAVAAIVAAARRFASFEAALVCGLLYITGGYVFLHAFALRSDMIGASLLAVALWIAMRRSPRALEILAIAVLGALAFVATIKSVLYAPAFLGIALARTSNRSHRWILLGVLASSLAAGALLLLVAPVMPDGIVTGTLRDIGLLGRDAAHRMFSAGLFPQPVWLREQILRAPLLAVVVILTVLFILYKRDRTAEERLLLLCLILPLCTIAVYRNAFPYHFVFILPPAVIATAPVIDSLLRRYRWILPGLMLFIAGILSLSEDRSVLPRQRIVLAGLHEIFPEPVTYIDDCGIVGDFPRAVNHYASGWGLVNYRRAGLPTYSMAMESEPVPLVLRDDGILGSLCFDFLHRRALLPEDDRAIRDNYIHHWGKAFVAGKRIAPGSEPQTFQIAVPGSYTIDGGPIVINNVPYDPGSIVELSRGAHTASGNRPVEVTLRWGNHLPLPEYSWPKGLLFTEF
jgi:hypothetical protein